MSLFLWFQLWGGNSYEPAYLLKILFDNHTKFQVDLVAKKQKLEDQLEEANKLKQFRNKRQEVIKDSLGKFLDAGELSI